MITRFFCRLIPSKDCFTVRRISTGCHFCTQSHFSMEAGKKAAVLYHYPCPDGAFAALAAHLFFSVTSTPAVFFPNTVYDPIRVEDLPLDEINDVYLLDFVGPSGFVQAIASKVERIVILDHHKTALEMLNGNTSVGKNVIKVIDMERSGATIAYDYFKKNLLGSGKISNSSSGAVGVGNELLPESSLKGVSLLQMFKYIEDADLWRWALPDSKAFSSGMKDMNIEYNVKLNPSLFEQLLKLDLQSVINQGMGSLSQKQKLIDEVLEQSFEIELGGGLFGRCLAVHGDSISDLRSELGNQLANKSNRVKLRYSEPVSDPRWREAMNEEMKART
ncbi:PREDICTED: uncharacterized protein LOC104590602 isoform X2 [Nelumbo nucifera]|uniref:Uncharacterized protein LOC104590602 isoform X2 n=1 Tax=Nelumbo nucifera TaxID=4432 RepID=A0A1U7Z3F0_NELNU|nr:PREDICTED: uncharacterized protein LOC104590602 isoform X2 [Nelumbo nucifera]